MERFFVGYDDCECMHCNSTEWRGGRFFHAVHNDSVLCTLCYKKLAKVEREDWKARDNASAASVF